MLSDSSLSRYRQWVARGVLAGLLTCTGCTAAHQATATRPEESAEVFLTPLVKTPGSTQPTALPKSTQVPTLTVNSWRKRSQQPNPGVVVQTSGERTVTEVIAAEPALMAPLPALSRQAEEPAEPTTEKPATETGPEKTSGKKLESGAAKKTPEAKVEPGPLPLELAAGPLLTLEEAESLARAGHPALLQAGEAIEKARGYHLQLGLKPNPQVGYTASEVFNEGHAGQQGVYVNQTFVRGHKQELDQEVLCREIARLEWEFRVQEARILTDVRQQYFQVLGNQRRIELLQKLEENVLAAAEGLKKLVEAGEIPEVDYLQMNLLASELKLKSENAEIELSAGRRQLAALLGKPDLSISKVAGELDAESPASDLETLFVQLLANSPQIQAANGRIARAQAMIMRQEQQNVPNVLAQSALMQDTSTNHTIFNLQLGIDLPYRNRNQGNIAAAVADYRRAVEQRRQLELSLRSQLAQTLGQLQQAGNSVRIYRDRIVPQAEQNLSKVQTAYDAGELDLTRLFVAQQGRVEASLALVAAQVNHRQLQALVDGTLLTGGLINEVDTELDSSLRGSSLDGQ